MRGGPPQCLPLDDLSQSDMHFVCGYVTVLVSGKYQLPVLKNRYVTVALTDLFRSLENIQSPV